MTPDRTFVCPHHLSAAVGRCFNEKSSVRVTRVLPWARCIACEGKAEFEVVT